MERVTRSIIHGMHLYIKTHCRNINALLVDENLRNEGYGKGLGISNHEFTKFETITIHNYSLYSCAHIIIPEVHRVTDSTYLDCPLVPNLLVERFGNFIRIIW